MEYTLADAAKIAGVNRSTLFRAIKSGKLSARRLDDKSYKVDASELARVYDLHQPMHNSDDALHHGAQVAQGAAQSAQDLTKAIELAELRVKVEQLERERETSQETIADLRKRLDSEQEERRALQRQLMPPEKPQEPPVVEDLRKRLEETEARILALSSPPSPEKLHERSIEVPVILKPARASRSFLSRLWGR